ncbi:MAG: thiamine phosphate synthase [Deltaproteobacteria bacterium]|nr:thiamine phosphate synthase [Deltaproteobacteria bacterium]
MVRKNMDFTLYLVTDRRWLGERTLWDGVEEAIRGGATLVQLREKKISSKEYLELAQRVKEVTDRHDIPLIINDRIDIAMAIDADGVHLGPEDLPVPIARKLLGDGKIIGSSAASVDEALLFQAQGADYLGVGAVFPTATKRGTEKVGLEDLRGIKSAVHIPVVAIGGINAENAKPVMETGVDGVAVVSAIMDQTDIREAARQLLSVLKGATT